MFEILTRCLCKREAGDSFQSSFWDVSIEFDDSSWIDKGGDCISRILWCDILVLFVTISVVSIAGDDNAVFHFVDG